MTNNKNIYVIIFIVLLILVTRHGTEENSFKENKIIGLPNYSPISPKNAWQVAVVGNGPISESQREMINNCQCIIRFNDAKNRRSNERTDVQVVRRQLGLGRIDRMFWKYYIPDGVYSFYLDATPRTWVPSYYGLKNLIEGVEIGIVGSKFEDDNILFPGCNKCNNSPCFYSISNYGASSGALVIDGLDSMDNIKELHIFGMNWNRGIPGEHVDFDYPNLVKECCKKCIFHKTPNNKYS